MRYGYIRVSTKEQNIDIQSVYIGMDESNWQTNGFPTFASANWESEVEF